MCAKVNHPVTLASQRCDIYSHEFLIPSCCDILSEVYNWRSVTFRPIVPTKLTFRPGYFCPTVKFCPDVPQRPCYPIYISSLEGCIASTNTWTTPSCGAETPPRTCSWLSGMARAIDVSVIVCSPLQVGCHARRKCISGKKCRSLCKNRDISLPWVKMLQRGECISGMKCHN